MVCGLSVKLLFPTLKILFALKVAELFCVKEIIWNSPADAFAAGHDTC